MVLLIGDKTPKKINAMPLVSLPSFIIAKKRMREEDSGLRDILDKIEEVLEASHGLDSRGCCCYTSKAHHTGHKRQKPSQHTAGIASQTGFYLPCL